MSRLVTQQVNGQTVELAANMKRKAVRLRHPTLRSCVYTVELGNTIYPEPHECPSCGNKHIFKTFHFNLNEHGEVAVHPDLYERLKNEGIITDLHAMKEVIPRPFALGMSFIDNTATLGIGGVVGNTVILSHPVLRNCVFTVELRSVTYDEPHQCPTCLTTHTYKTFHLNLNEGGYVAVHRDIYALFLREGIIGELSLPKARPQVFSQEHGKVG